jgi:hypothetical protein
MKLFIFIQFLCVILLNCNSFSEMKEIKNESKGTNFGKLTIVYKDSEANAKYLRKMQIRISKFQPIPKKELTVGVITLIPPIIIPIPYNKETGQIVPSFANFFADGYMEKDKEYSFEIEEGDYFASLGNTFIDHKSTDRGMYIDDNGVEKKVFSQFTVRNNETCNSAQLYDSAILGGKATLCGGIHIKKGSETKIEILGKEKEIQLMQTFVIWVPFSVILAPYFTAPIWYEQNFTVQFN